MTTFRGRAHIKLDPKGRLSLPSTFRGPLAESRALVVTNGTYKGLPFLDLLTPKEWLKLESKISKLSTLKSEVQVIQRFYLSSGENCEIDSQFRILLPQHLRIYAKFEENIVLVGMGSKVEIWSEKNWQTTFSQLKADYESALAVLANLDTHEKKK